MPVLSPLLWTRDVTGLMTYATNRRTGEIGIRMALGATRGEIAGMVLRETLLLVLLGLAIGVPAAMASSHLIRSELYGLRTNDPLTEQHEIGFDAEGDSWQVRIADRCLSN